MCSTGDCVGCRYVSHAGAISTPSAPTKPAEPKQHDCPDCSHGKPKIPEKIRYEWSYEGTDYNTGEMIWWLAAEKGFSEKDLEEALPKNWRFYGNPVITAEIELDTKTGETTLVRIIDK